MDLIIFDNSLWHLIPITKTMLQGLEIPKEVDCMELCKIIRENFTTYIDSKNITFMNGNKNHLFYGCICGAEAPQ